MVYMKVKTPPTVTDNITELLNHIIDFTERRKEVLTRNLSDCHSVDFVPKDLAVHEFADILTHALAEHLQNKRLLLEDRQNVRFYSQGEFAAAPMADNESMTLLRSNLQAYIQEQIRKLSENLIHSRLAGELLRQKRQKELAMAGL
jgi:flagellar basal body rod protein FlgB